MSEVNPEFHVNSAGTLLIRRNSGGGAEASGKEEEEETCDGLRIAAIPQCMSNFTPLFPKTIPKNWRPYGLWLTHSARYGVVTNNSGRIRTRAIEPLYRPPGQRRVTVLFVEFVAGKLSRSEQGRAQTGGVRVGRPFGARRGVQ